MLERSDHPRLVRQVGAREGAAYNYEGERVMLRRSVAGTVDVPSGELLMCDPRNRGVDSVAVRVPQGSHPAYVTSFRGEYAELHEPITATLAVRVRETGRVTFAPLGRDAMTAAVHDPDDAEDDGLQFLGVDGDSVYVCDRGAWAAYDGGRSLLPTPSGTMTEELTAPEASTRFVRVATGLGSGGYPVFGGYDASGDLAVVYASFDLVFEGERVQEPWIDDEPELPNGALPSS